jgi:hypothetical protein
METTCSGGGDESEEFHHAIIALEHLTELHPDPPFHESDSFMTHVQVAARVGPCFDLTVRTRRI